jgi:hypothetical protein
MTEENEKQNEDENSESVEKSTSDGKGIPSHLQPDFSRHEAAMALRPGFRNPGNKNSKAQRRKKKKR